MDEWKKIFCTNIAKTFHPGPLFTGALVWFWNIFFIIFHFQRVDEWKKIFNTNIAKTFHHGSFYQSGYWRIGEIRGNIIIFEVWTHTLCHSRTVIQSKIFISNAIFTTKTVLKRELKIKFRYNIVAVIRGKVGYTKSIYSIFLFSCVNQKRISLDSVTGWYPQNILHLCRSPEFVATHPKSTYI